MKKRIFFNEAMAQNGLDVEQFLSLIAFTYDVSEFIPFEI